MITCWVALDDTRAQGGTIEYVRGSHRWPKVPPSRGEFHAPEDWLAPAREAAPEGEEPESRAGGGQGRRLPPSTTRSPSTARAPTRPTTHRRALVSHLIPVETRFHPTEVDLVYSRYRRRGDLSLDESFFPVIWDETGARSAWLAELPALPIGPAVYGCGDQDGRRSGRRRTCPLRRPRSSTLNGHAAPTDRLPSLP